MRRDAVQIYRIKTAQTEAEREQVHRLNYATFVEEIPQHAPNPERRLVDRFDAENEYVIALAADGQVVGMLALRARRPFSLDQKLERLDDYLPPHRSVCELRLLAVRPEHRHSALFRDLIAHTARRCVAAGHDLAVISGTTRQLALYRHLGFEPFGPVVGAAGAQFQPMLLALERLRAGAGATLGVAQAAPEQRATARFIPGPVATMPAVRAAFDAEAETHRSGRFLAQVARVRRGLCEMAGAAQTALMVGSGTLANDVVAASIRELGGHGLVLSNGEFGERLLDHARGAALGFEVLRKPWGSVFEEAELRDAVQRSGAHWIWGVHCETSTGVLNDLELLRRTAGAARARLCLDCISTLGTIAVDLHGVWLASGASGKGLGAYPGLSLVLVNGDLPARSGTVPRYLDLQLWLRHDSVPFTHSSNLVGALETALLQTDWEERIGRTARDARWLRAALRAQSLKQVAPEAAASPGVVSIELPAEVPSRDVAEGLERRGFEVAWRSAYLADRNWIQVALMGDYDRPALRELPAAIALEVRERARRADRAA
jgi:aspartate aminotransferase-like enzyme/ribosomal protein S18 acetylase RimI-like enzyme